ncbi:general secretion pathway protein C [Halopseudomonas litoralis]|uniref:General secretion pathway protein C n=1 Tax=Halopseudomonas litoralis TaxID=797277 RepID=A0A1H1Q5V7_9GAMM|nr:hypothetical protein [Halopseudomonas litoralis]SDS18891.1 general secretion pathway protein C [Halopseudomonas litoralis]
MSVTWRLPQTVSPVRLIHAAGLLAVAAGVCVWGYVLYQPESAPVQEAEVSVIVADAAGEAMAGWFGSEPVRLDVTVIGLVRKSDRAVAVLSVNGSPAQAYMPGESLMNDVVLTSIETDGVTVERAGVESQIAAPAIPDTGPDGISRVPRA